MIAWGLVYLCNTAAWRTLLDGAIPFRRAYFISISSFAINYVTPLVSLGGEPFRITAASAYVDTPRATASVVAFRVIHTLAQLLFWMMAATDGHAKNFSIRLLAQGRYRLTRGCIAT